MRPLTLLLALIAAVPAAAQQLPPDSVRVYELAEVEVLPRPLNFEVFSQSLARGYPPHLRQAGVGGTVRTDFVVDPDGWPVNVRVLESPDTSLIVPSVRALLLLRFSPARVQGRPVFVRVEQPITWRVDSAAIAAAATASEGPQGLREGEFELAQVEILPRPLNMSEFERAMARHYPELPNPLAQAVSVQVRFLVREDGSVREPRVMHSADPRFDEATLRAVRVLRFTPAMLNGGAVKVWVEQPIQWRPRQ